MAPANLLILSEREAVSRAKRSLNIAAVSEILTFKFILLLKAVSFVTKEEPIVVESDLNLLVIAIESCLIFVLIFPILSANAPPDALSKVLILLESEAVSLAILLLNISNVSAIFTFKLIRLDNDAVSRANLEVNILAVSAKFNLSANCPVTSEAEDNPSSSQFELSFRSPVKIVGVFNL